MVDEVFSFLMGRIEHSFRELLDTGEHKEVVIGGDGNSYMRSCRAGVQASNARLQAGVLPGCKTPPRQVCKGLKAACVLSSTPPPCHRGIVRNLRGLPGFWEGGLLEV
jgi:hypothetical protein